jgi:outer membrane protein OmpA-like peptidoglycan-associated protein
MAASFTDLMASLMVIFILLFVAYSNNVSRSKGSATQSVLEALKKGLAGAGMDASRVERDPRDRYAIVVVMPDSLLFERGSYDVLDAGRRYIDRFAPTFAHILCGEPRGLIETVVVQGHTDTTFVGWGNGDGTPLAERGRAFNLELSQNRSLAVVKTCLESLRDSPDRPTFLRLLSASGRGQEEPLPGYSGDAPQQRRVAFKVRVQVDALSEIAGRLPHASAVVSSER